MVNAASGTHVDVPIDSLGLRAWVTHYPYALESAAQIHTQSSELDAVWAMCAYTLRVTTLDFYADSNTRQRSLDCMADDTTAALNHYATTSELALPRMVSAQIMDIGPVGESCSYRYMCYIGLQMSYCTL